MDLSERMKLQRSWSYLVDDLSVDDVQDLLIQEGILSFDDRDQIYAGDVTRKESVRRLLQIIVRRGPDAYRTFLEALSGPYPHLYKTLEESAVSPLMKVVQDEDVLKVQVALKQRYYDNALVVKLFPWAERSPHLNGARLFNRLVLKSKVRGNYVRDIEHEQLFSPGSDGKVPRLILVEGDPGVGKTFLCRKVAYDWGCHGQADVSNIYFTHTFEFVVLVDVRSLRRGFEHAVKGLLRGTHEQKKLTYEYIMAHPSQCLFIIDGLDEGRYPEVKSALHDLLSDTEFPGAYILATCRSNMANEFSDYFQREVKNLGFTLSQAKRYIRSFFEADKEMGESLLTFLCGSQDISSDIQKTPLKCFMLCTWWSDPHRKLPSGRVTITALYAMMERQILRRYSEKSKIPDDILVEMDKLCRVALHGLIHAQFQFSPGALLQFNINDDSRSLRLGFLTREYSVTSDEEGEQVYYSFPHLSMQEYLAAKCVYQLAQEYQLMFITFMSCQNEFNNVCMFLAGLLRDGLAVNSLFVCRLLSTEKPSLSDGMGHQHCIKALKQAQCKLKKYGCRNLCLLDRILTDGPPGEGANVLGKILQVCASLLADGVCVDCRKGSLQGRAMGNCLFWCQKMNCEFASQAAEAKQPEKSQKSLVLNEFLPGYRKELDGNGEVCTVSQVLPVAGRWQCVYVRTNVDTGHLNIDCRNAEGLAWALLHREKGYPIKEVFIDMASVGDEEGPSEQTVRTVRQQLGLLCDEGLRNITLECEQIRSIGGILPQGKTVDELRIHAWTVDGTNVEVVLANIASCRVNRVDITLGSIIKVLKGDLCRESLEAISKRGDDLERNVKNIGIKLFCCIVEACDMKQFLSTSVCQYVVFQQADVINIDDLDIFHLVLQMPLCTFKNCRLIAKRNIRLMTVKSEVLLLYDWTNLRVCPNTWTMITNHAGGSAGIVGQTLRLPYVTYDDSLSTFLTTTIPVLARSSDAWSSCELMCSSNSVQSIVDAIRKHGGSVSMTTQETDQSVSFTFKEI